MKPGFITGLKFEADILASAGKIYCAGGSIERAEQGALILIDQGADIIVSFGIAGALKPGLAAGNLIIADQVVMADRDPLPCDPRINNADAITGTILSSADPVRSIEDKEQLLQKTGAIAVDMESYGAAYAAHSRDIPFAAIRAIADPAERSIPKAALSGMADDGSLKIGSVILELLKRPQDLPALIRLGNDTRRAKQALRRAAFLLFTDPV